MEFEEPLALLIGSLGQPMLAHERRCQERRDPFLPAADQELLAVLVDRPAHRQSEIGDRLVESRKMAIPFAPFLALGSVVALFWGRPLLDTYLGLLGA